MTAIAFLEFQKQKVEVGIFETGLGGRLDSTNVLEPMISVITSIGYDHCEILGNSIKEIAREKAGIIKKFKPVVIGCLTKEARIEVESIARKKMPPFILSRSVKIIILARIFPVPSKGPMRLLPQKQPNYLMNYYPWTENHNGSPAANLFPWQVANLVGKSNPYCGCVS